VKSGLEPFVFFFWNVADVIATDQWNLRFRIIPFIEFLDAEGALGVPGVPPLLADGALGADGVVLLVGAAIGGATGAVGRDAGP
jgi:hypothetical protein